jgi:hypothetical protein
MPGRVLHQNSAHNDAALRFLLCRPPLRACVLCACGCVCSQAEGSWSKERCCAVQANNCPGNYCEDHTASNDYLYRLSPGEPERYESTLHNTNYQTTRPSYWPKFGPNGDLFIGSNGPPGTGGHCDQGNTYRGSFNAACGGGRNTWRHTDLEVWRPL